MEAQCYRDIAKIQYRRYDISATIISACRYIVWKINDNIADTIYRHNIADIIGDIYIYIYI